MDIQNVRSMFKVRLEGGVFAGYKNSQSSLSEVVVGSHLTLLSCKRQGVNE